MLNVFTLNGFGVSYTAASGAWANRRYKPTRLSDTWASLASGAGGTVDATSLNVADAFLTGLMTSTFSGKIIYYLPFIGTNINAIKVPLVDKLGSGNAILSGFSESNYNQASGIFTDTNRCISLPLGPSDLNSTNQMGGVGAWELSNTRPAALNNHICTAVSPANTDTFGLQWYKTLDVIYWGQNSNSRWAAPATTKTGDFHYGQRSATDVLEYFHSGVSRLINANSYTPTFDTVAKFYVGRQTAENSWSQAQIGSVILTDGTLTSGEVSGLRALIRDTIIVPLGRAIL